MQNSVTFCISIYLLYIQQNTVSLINATMHLIQDILNALHNNHKVA